MSRTLVNLINNFTILLATKVNLNHCEALTVGGSSTSSPDSGLKRDDLKCLGVFLGNDAMVQRNWEYFTEKIEGKLNKWKWLLPQLAYRGRVLVLSNLVAFLLSSLDPF